MARYRFKEFDPKPFTPGARIEWDHRLIDHSVVRRSGIVWSGAPAMRDGGRAVWVTPDEALPGDVYSALFVVIPPQRRDGTAEENMPWSGDATHAHYDTPGVRTLRAARAAQGVRMQRDGAYPTEWVERVAAAAVAS